mmetsp:Transcript_29896/g.50249  ORF Transcript_29896/g.50249 Transcript_29896/m.50249 type:complete len:217 (+) Transcript_29896:4088-4738(+)
MRHGVHHPQGQVVVARRLRNEAHAVATLHRRHRGNDSRHLGGSVKHCHESVVVAVLGATVGILGLDLKLGDRAIAGRLRELVHDEGSRGVSGAREDLDVERVQLLAVERHGRRVVRSAHQVRVRHVVVAIVGVHDGERVHLPAGVSHCHRVRVPAHHALLLARRAGGDDEAANLPRLLGDHVALEGGGRGRGGVVVGRVGPKPAEAHRSAGRGEGT